MLLDLIYKFHYKDHSRDYGEVIIPVLDQAHLMVLLALSILQRQLSTRAGQTVAEEGICHFDKIAQSSFSYSRLSSDMVHIVALHTYLLQTLLILLDALVEPIQENRDREVHFLSHKL